MRIGREQAGFYNIVLRSIYRFDLTARATVAIDEVITSHSIHRNIVVWSTLPANSLFVCQGAICYQRANRFVIFFAPHLLLAQAIPRRQQHN